MTELFAALRAGWTPGATGIWVLVGMALVYWWRGLPAVMEAYSNSVAKEREHRRKEISRLESQIAAADQRHEECLEGQRAAHEESRLAHEETRGLREEVGRLQNIITGMMIQFRQLQLSAGEGFVMPIDLTKLLASMEQPPKGSTS